MSVLIYPGTFDPVTNGHADIARRAAKLCDRLYVVVLPNVNKSTHFTLDERIAMLKSSLSDIENCMVETYDGLLVDYVKLKHAMAVVRGLRSESDFRYELEMATANRLLYKDFESILLPTSSELAFTSSTIVREVAQFGGDISGMVPAPVREFVAERLRKKQEDR